MGSAEGEGEKIAVGKGELWRRRVVGFSEGKREQRSSNSGIEPTNQGSIVLFDWLIGCWLALYVAMEEILKREKRKPTNLATVVPSLPTAAAAYIKRLGGRRRQLIREEVYKRAARRGSWRVGRRLEGEKARI